MDAGVNAGVPGPACDKESLLPTSHQGQAGRNEKRERNAQKVVSRPILDLGECKRVCSDGK